VQKFETCGLVFEYVVESGRVEAVIGLNAGVDVVRSTACSTGLMAAARAVSAVDMQ